jgi:hypothetical protein
MAAVEIDFTEPSVLSPVQFEDGEQSAPVFLNRKPRTVGICGSLQGTALARSPEG